MDLRALRAANRRGRSGTKKSSQRLRGRYIRYEPWQRGHTIRDLALAGTVLKRALKGKNELLPLSLDDLQVKVRRNQKRRVVVFVVDASGSMKSKKRMGAAKGAVLGLLTSAYQSRDRVGLVIFREDGANVILAPTKSVTRARHQLRALTVGGSSPLAAGLLTGWNLLRQERARYGELEPVLVVVSDGEANVPLDYSNPIEDELNIVARRIRDSQIQSLVLDTKDGAVALRYMRKLAKKMMAQYHHISRFDASEVVNAIQGK